MNELQIECFFAVAELSSFSRAAEKLFVTQSAVSKQIRALEDEWGVTLFNRKQRRVELTEAGKFLLEQVRFLTASLESSLEQARRMERQEAIPTLRVGLFERHAFRQFSRLCREFMREHNLNIMAEEQNFASLNEGLKSRKFDVIVTLESMVTKLDFIQYKPMMPTQYTAFLSRSHPLAGKEELEFGDLAGECFYVPTLGDNEITLNNARNVCAANGFTLQAHRFVPNVKTALIGVTMNQGVVLLDDFVYLEDSDEYVKLPSGRYSNVILAWHKQDRRNVISEFTDFILANSESIKKERGI